jgi:hypothetical protein
VTFAEILDELGAEYRTEGHEHCRPGWLQFDCPWCSRGWRHFRMGYNLARRYVNCWACGKHGLTDTVAELAQKPRKAIAGLLADLPRERVVKERLSGRLELPAGVGPLQAPHYAYLARRGFDADVVARTWGVAGIGIAPRLGWRLFIPIVWRGEVVSWTTRSISDRTDRRYRSAKETQEKVPHKKILYGADLVRHAVIIHEGPIDVWRTGPGAVALMGTSFSQSQVRYLARYARRVVCFDSERAAQERARALCDALMVFPGTTQNVRLESGKDPAVASDNEINELRGLIA